MRLICSLMLLLCLTLAPPVYAVIDTDVGRNEYSSDTTFGTNQNANKDQSMDDSDLLSSQEMEDTEARENRTSFVDSCIYTTGCLIWIGDIIWVSFAVLELVAPALTSPVVRFITRGQEESLGYSMTGIMARFCAVAVIGAFFVTGDVKTWLGTLLGWILSR